VVRKEKVDRGQLTKGIGTMTRAMPANNVLDHLYVRSANMSFANSGKAKLPKLPINTYPI
jgi:hypothetical protein